MTLARRLSFRGHYTPPYIQSPLDVGGAYDPTWSPLSPVLTQLHCHTTQSDGAKTPEEIVAGYLAKGYGALAITDHDMVTTQPDGIGIKISGNELSPSSQHIVSINSDYVRGGLTAAQAQINGVLAAGGQCHVAHPRWSTGMTYAEMAALTGQLGLEIHNGHCITGLGQNPVTYPAFAIDRWDDLLRAGYTQWAFAVDDLHTPPGPYENYDLGRVHVFPEASTTAGVVSALVAGAFVADVGNYGVTPGYPTRSSTDLSVTCAGATRIEAWGADGFLTGTDGTSHTHTFEGSEQYVRLEAIGDYSEPFDADLDDRWYTVDGSWAVAGGVLAISSDDTHGRVVLRRHRAGDFTASVDIDLVSDTGFPDGALMFNVLSSSYYYIIRLGEAGTSGFNNKLALAKTTTGSFGSSPLASYAITPSYGTWYTIDLDYTASSGRIRARVYERGTAAPDWQIDYTDATWHHGAVGFRANRSVRFDNLAVDGFRTYYQPVTVAPA